MSGPGPLRAVGPDVLGPNDITVAHCRYGGEAPGPVYGTYQEAVALAQLFAAAPALLAACAAALDEDSGMMCRDQLREALALAGVALE